jgi:O-antigen/teichoic acid export membrane protein
MARRVWPYSASYLSASIYSNGPAVIVGLLGGVAQGALYSIVSRMTQPTELVPQALSAVNLPRLTLAEEASRPALFRRQAIQAGSAGVAVAAGLLLSAPLTLQLFRLPFGRAFPLLVILAAILPLKFLSYQLVALLIAEGRVRARLRASAFVAVLSVVAVCAVAWNGAVSAAAVTLGCECLLVTLLYLAARTTAHAAFLGDARGGYGPVAP